jgi:hypothetical protein
MAEYADRAIHQFLEKRRSIMTDHGEAQSLDPNRMGSVSGGTGTLGVYRTGFRHKKESLQFFKACVGDDVYAAAMNSDAGRAHHYAVARAFLDQKSWERFVWIEEYGSLDGFPEQ